MEAIFEFLLHFIHDYAHIFLFVPESKNDWLDVWTFATTYKFVLIRDWWGINFTLLYSSLDAFAKVCVTDNYFKFLLWKHRCWHEKHSYINIHNVVGFVEKKVSHIFVPPSQKM
jgi:hypothetical protein